MTSSKLTRRVGIVFLGEGIGVALTALLAIVIVRLASKGEYGTYQQTWLVHSMLSPILFFGIPASISFFIPQFTPEEEKGFVAQTALYLLLGGILLGIGIYLGAEPLARSFENPELTRLLRIFSLYPVLAMPTAILNGLFIARGEARKAAIYRVISKLVTPLTAVMAFIAGVSLDSLFRAVLITQALFLVGAYAYLLRMYRPVGLRWKREWVRQQFDYSMPIGLSTIIGTLSRGMDSMLISLVYSVEQFATYAVGAFEIPVFRMLSSALNDVLTPHFVSLLREQRLDDLLRIWHKSVIKLSLLIFPSFIFLLAIAEPFVILLYTDEYAASTTLFRIFLFLFPLRVVQYTMPLRVTGRTRQIFWGNLFFISVNLVLMLVLVGLIGFLGPALATVIASFLVSYFYLWHSSQALQVPMGRILPWKDLAALLLIAALPGLPVVLILGLPLPDLPRMFLAGIVYLALFTPLVIRTGYLGRSDWELVRDWIGRMPGWRK